jgi:hypothetical protein
MLMWFGEQLEHKLVARSGDLGLSLPAPLVPPGSFQLVKVHGGLARGRAPGQGPSPLNVPIIVDAIVAID